jgi:hypothetical protein
MEIYISERKQTFPKAFAFLFFDADQETRNPTQISHLEKKKSKKPSLPSPPKMPQHQQPATGSHALDSAPLFAIILAAVHVLALVLPHIYHLVSLPPSSLVRSAGLTIPPFLRILPQVFWIYKLASQKQPTRTKTH